MYLDQIRIGTFNLNVADKQSQIPHPLHEKLSLHSKYRVCGASTAVTYMCTDHRSRISFTTVKFQPHTPLDKNLDLHDIVSLAWGNLHHRDLTGAISIKKGNHTTGSSPRLATANLNSKKKRVGAVTILWKKGFNGAAGIVYDRNCARHSAKLGEGWLVREKRCDEFLVLTTLGRFGAGMG